MSDNMNSFKLVMNRTIYNLLCRLWENKVFLNVTKKLNETKSKYIRFNLKNSSQFSNNVKVHDTNVGKRLMFCESVGEVPTYIICF